MHHVVVAITHSTSATFCNRMDGKTPPTHMKPASEMGTGVTDQNGLWSYCLYVQFNDVECSTIGSHTGVFVPVSKNENCDSILLPHWKQKAAEAARLRRKIGESKDQDINSIVSKSNKQESKPKWIMQRDSI